MEGSQSRRNNNKLIKSLVPVEPHELAAVLWSFFYFFCLLGGYYILRPVRDEMGIVGGVENLQWLFTGTFVAMLVAVPIFGWLASRLPRWRFVPIVYYFFIGTILLFFLLFRLGVADVWVARAFFIWISVFNLFVVSVFWSLMADIFSHHQAQRLFGLIAAGGSAGAIAGPLLAGVLAPLLGPINLLPLAAALLGVALVAIHKLRGWEQPRQVADLDGAGTAEREQPLGGGAWSGVVQVIRNPYLLGICLFVLLYTTLSTFLYFQQAHIVRDAFTESAQRTAVFAWIDLAVNALTIGAQLLVTHRLVERFDVGATLAVVPALLMAGFAGLAAAPILPLLLAVQVARRAGNYAITRPAREMLFTVLGRDDKYKSKNFIDTVVYRAGDAAAGWFFAGLLALGLGLAGIALVAVPLAALWLAIGIWLGRHHQARREQHDK